MKKITVTLILALVFLTGCDTLRFAPSQIQKQNAYLHNRTTRIAADTTKKENSSQKLQTLTELSNLQSKSYVSYFGLPKELPQADTAEQILSQSSYQLALDSLDESNQRPDAFEVADNVFELGIGICALLGGVYGTRAVRFLKEARDKSKALQEVVQNNELFKKQNPDSKEVFKQAQKLQSPQTRKLVTEIRA